MTEYRQDDETRGFCPACGQECVNITVGAKGVCPQHGWVFVNWAPPENVPEEEEEEL